MNSPYIGKYAIATSNGRMIGYILEDYFDKVYLHNGAVLRKDDEYYIGCDVTEYTWQIKTNDNSIKSKCIGKEVKSVNNTTLGKVVEECDNYLKIKTQDGNVMSISKTHNRKYMPKTLDKWWYLE